MIFWKKDDKNQQPSGAVQKTAPAVDSKAPKKPTHLFDISSVKIPESDTGGFKEEVEIDEAAVPPLPSFLYQKKQGAGNSRPSQNVTPPTPSTQSIHLTVPPIPTQNQETPLPQPEFLSQKNTPEDVDFTLPPLPTFEDNSEEPVETLDDIQEEAVEEADFTLPPLPTFEDDSEEPVETLDDIQEEAVEDAEEADFTLPPLPTFEDDSEEPVETLEDTQEEAAEAVEDVDFTLPPLPTFEDDSEEPVETLDDTQEEAVEEAEEADFTLPPLPTFEDDSEEPLETLDDTQEEAAEAVEEADFTLPPLPTFEDNSEEPVETLDDIQEEAVEEADFTLPPLPTFEDDSKEPVETLDDTQEEAVEEAEEADFTLPPLPTFEDNSEEPVETLDDIQEEAVEEAEEADFTLPPLPTFEDNSEEPVGTLDDIQEEAAEDAEEADFTLPTFENDTKETQEKDNDIMKDKTVSTEKNTDLPQKKLQQNSFETQVALDVEKEATQIVQETIALTQENTSTQSKKSVSDQTESSEKNETVMAQPPKTNTFVRQEEPVSTLKKKEPTDTPVTESKQKAPLNPIAQQAAATVKNIAPVEARKPMTKADYISPSFLKGLFANGNVCVTAQGGSFPIKDDTRLLLALFSNGRFFVSETYKFDGKVLGFEYLAKKRHLQIGKPEYVPMPILNMIYEYAAQNAAYAPEIVDKNEEQEQAQARMQRDFITIVSRAAAMHVSDIHIVVADHTTVMFRANGLMQTEMEYNKDWGESFVRAAFASADISDSNYAQNEYQAAQKLGRTPLRGSRGKLILPRNILGIRLQFNPIAFGTRYVVMRLLYAEENVDNSSALEALGFTKRETDFFYQLRGAPTGITIISGPTGSGKSTTLQRNMIAMLQERNYEINLITVEDPPEYPIPGARQMPVTNASIEEAKEREFTKALSAALRSDPDSLMIGEVRTLSAADLAFRGALSGHNVWTTLHANSAPAILMRLKDLGVEDFKLRDPEIIKGLLAQRLFRKLCPHCRVAAMDDLKNPSVQRLREAFGDVGLETSYLRGRGCKHCDFRGVKGRLAVAEIILPDATFLELMSKTETQKAMNYWINDLNGMTLREVALQHMFRGTIDIVEVERWTGFLNQVITG